MVGGTRSGCGKGIKRRMGSTEDDEQAVILFLRERDVPCPLCGYNLRGLMTPRCPECGREIRLSIGLVEPFMRCWIALFSATTASAGVGVLFWMLVAREGWPRGDGPLMQISFGYFLISPLFAIPVLVFRRVIIKWPRGVQWLYAVVAIVASILAAFAFMMTVR